MSLISKRLSSIWRSVGNGYLPFADVATPDLPLQRLLRLSLFQVSVGMTLVLLVGTLNRVMIVELSVPSSLVGIMLAMPLLFAPFRAFIGFRSDKHQCALGWRRVPFIWNGTLLTFAGLSVMPFALLVLAGKGESAHLPEWIGLLAAAIAFLLAGAGVHVVQTTGLALATDLTPKQSHPRVVGFLYVALLVGMLVSALAFGVLLDDFTPGKLIQVVQGSAVVAVLLNVISIWKQEPRHSQRVPNADDTGDFWQCFAGLCSVKHARRQLVVVGIGTLAFGMAELILEPFGGEVLEMSVSSTTRLTAVLALGGLAGFTFASRVLARGDNAHHISRNGAAIGIPGFVLVVLSAQLQITSLFVIANFLIGFGGALFGHGTLTATMNNAPEDKTGMALGAWGAVQATAAGLGVALSGTLRDLINTVTGANHATGYHVVYGIELLLLVLALLVIAPLTRMVQPKKVSTI